MEKEDSKLKLLDPGMVNIIWKVAILRTTEDFKREYKRRLSL